MSQTVKILFVDDEPDLAPLIRQKFRRDVRQGTLELVFAGDGVEALEHIEADPDIEVVVTDLNMPRMDGLTLLGRLAESGRRHKAVVVTAYGDMENIRTAMNRGAFDFLTKPIDLSDLEITLDQARTAVEREREASRVRAAFGRYLSNEIAQAILSEPNAFDLGGETREVSVLMSDLSGFSQAAAQLEPQRVVELLNVYLGAMTDVVDEYGGAIDEFIGDAVLVIFGAPIARPDHAQRAVACAIAMQRKMDEVNAELAARDLLPTRMTVAVNTGEVVVGNIGSPKRAKYGVVGTPVNMTSRIQTLAAPGEVLVSDATLRAAGDTVTVASTRHASLKGYTEPIPIHSLAGIGAPYGLDLPRTDASPKLLYEPIDFTFSILDGKQVSSERKPGRLVEASVTEAIAHVQGLVDERVDLCLHISLPSAPEGCEAYAKVLSAEPQGDGVRVHLGFSPLPASVVRVIAERTDG
ncbi:MAG: adenylate/guanylate cyclase domain-containing protein [Bacteroidota bacterium]